MTLSRRGFLSRLFKGAVLGTALALGVRPEKPRRGNALDQWAVDWQFGSFRDVEGIWADEPRATILAPRKFYVETWCSPVVPQERSKP